MKHLIIFAAFFSSGVIAMQSSQQMPQEIATFKRSDRWIEIGIDENMQMHWEKEFPKRRQNKMNETLCEVSDNDALYHYALSALKKGANPNFTLGYQWTAFEIAIRSDAVKIAWLMSERNADCAHGLRVLMDHACLTRRQDLFNAQRALFAQFIKKLREKNTDIDESDTYGETALMHISKVRYEKNRTIIKIPIEYRVSYVKDLIDAGADPAKRDAYGESALAKAQKNNLKELIPLLRKK